MSDEVLAPMIAVAILVALALWVPALHLCDGCWKRLRRRPAMNVEPVEGVPDAELDRTREVA